MIAALSLDKNNTNYKNSNGNLTKSFKEIIIETAESFDNGISGKIKQKQSLLIFNANIRGKKF